MNRTSVYVFFLCFRYYLFCATNMNARKKEFSNLCSRRKRLVGERLVAWELRQEEKSQKMRWHWVLGRRAAKTWETSVATIMEAEELPGSENIDEEISGLAVDIGRIE